MNKGLSNIVIFAVGAAIGSAATWYVLKTKYEQIAQEEIDSVKEVFHKRQKELEEIIDEVPEKEAGEPEPSLKEYEDTIMTTGYAKHSEITTVAEEADKMDILEPYVISPDEVGDSDYEIVTLYYYADKVLTDDQDNIIEDVDGLIGSDSLNHFGEYEEDSVCVRNDNEECDYEILLDTRKFSELGPKYYDPPTMED